MGEESDARKQFGDYSPAQMGTQTKDVLDTRWVLTWKEAEGVTWKKVRGALGCVGVSGPGSQRWLCGFRGAREQKVDTFAPDFFGGHEEMGVPEPGFRKWLSPRGCVRPRGNRTCPMRVEFQGLSQYLEIEGPCVWHFVGPRAGFWRHLWDRCQKQASDLRRHRLTRASFRISEIGR